MYKRYPLYKDSGIEWIGEIPEHWETIRTRFVFNVISGNGFPEDLQGRSWGDYPFYKCSDINVNGIFAEQANNYVDIADVQDNKWSIVPKQSIIFAKIGEALKKNHRKINSSDCLVDNNMMAIALKNPSDDVMYYYFLMCLINMEWFVNPGAVPSVDVSKFRSFFILRIKSGEQVQIESFIKNKTSQIDNLIAKKEQMIELLKEERTAIINQAVTKGLDPDVEMKDSGIEWLGKIPKHWEIKKLKHTTYIKGRVGWQALTTNEYVTEGPFLVTGTDFIEGNIFWDTCFRVSQERYNMDPYIQLRKGDLLITKDGTIGKVAVVRNMPAEKATLNSGVFLTRPLASDIYLSDYMYWILNSETFAHFIDYTKKGSTISHLYQEVFREFIFATPSLKEQGEIVEHLNFKTKEIDNLIERCSKQILLLKEYRTALISEVVTGKIDVRGEE